VETSHDMTPRARAGGSRGSPTGTARPPRLALASRTPPHPGQFLESRFLTPLSITQTDLAAALGVSRRRVNELIRGRRAITPDTAVRLAIFFGNDPTFWMHLQVAWDMHAAARKISAANRR
jgi:antitoxin HigA-1